MRCSSPKTLGCKHTALLRRKMICCAFRQGNAIISIAKQLLLSSTDLVPSLTRLEESIISLKQNSSGLAQFLSLSAEIQSIASGILLIIPEFESVDQKISVQDLRNSCSCLLVIAGAAERRVLGCSQVYACIKAATTGIERRGGSDADEALVITEELEKERYLARELIIRLQQQGYHPELQGASFSVVMTKEEKMVQLETFRLVWSLGNLI
jgi:hypothetical protein